MRIACRITKATDTHSEYVITIPFPRQQLLRECASVSRYSYGAVLNRIVIQLSGNKSKSAGQSVSQSVLMSVPCRVSRPDFFQVRGQALSWLSRGVTSDARTGLHFISQPALVICSDIHMYILWFQSCLLHISKSFLCINNVKYIHSLGQSSPYEVYHAPSCPSKATTAT